MLPGTYLSLMAQKPAAHIPSSLQKRVLFIIETAAFRSCGHGKRIKKNLWKEPALLIFDTADFQ